MKNFLLSFLLILLNSAFLQAQDKKPAAKRTHYAAKLNAEAPRIDGLFEEPAWQAAPWRGSFTQLNPNEGEPASERTLFKVLYGAKNIYFALMCYDAQPDKITARISRRDDVEDSDFIAVGLDSYFDKRTAFTFGINAAGVKMDIIFTEDGDRSDDSWDPVWEGAVTRSDSGWAAEMRIPYSQLRFADKEEQVWGFQVLRKIFRKQEEDMWQPMAKDDPGMVSFFGTIRGIKDIKMPLRVEIMPYAVGSLTRYERQKGNPFADGSDFDGNMGLDAKIGLTSDLTMDVTINPDFGQVEADPSEVNLSAYETFFEEKRPFFIEGEHIFSFPMAMGDGDMSAEQLFYSRRIGRRPHYYPDGDDGFHYDYVDQPAQTAILGAAKISGKTKTGWSVGILDAVTRIEKAELDFNGNRKKATVEPLTNYFVNRLQKDFNEGNTSFGGILTAVNRKIEDRHLDFLNKSAYTGGIDFRHQWADKTYFISFKAAGSYLTGKPEAIVQAQRSAARYYQRPDAGHVHLDSSRTSLSGHGGSYAIGRGGKSNWNFGTGGTWRSPGFEINDIGFLREADKFLNFVWISYRERNPVGIFRSYRINFNEWQGWNFDGDHLFTGGNINVHGQFLNYWSVGMGVNRQQAGLTASLLRGGPMAAYQGGWNNWGYVSSDSRKDVQISSSVSTNFNDDGISKRINGNVRLYYKVNEQINISMNPFYAYRVENLQYVDQRDLNGDERYVFGRLKQNTAGLVFRLNYSPTPNLSVQYFGQPFTSAGVYSVFKQIDNPRGKGDNRYTVYSDASISYDKTNDWYSIDETGDGSEDYGFGKPDFNVQEFLSNLVIRWEYKPGSLLYFVWSQNRSAFNNMRDFSLGDDMSDLFDTHPTNVFLIKMNYWFSL